MGAVTRDFCAETTAAVVFLLLGDLNVLEHKGRRAAKRIMLLNLLVLLWVGSANDTVEIAGANFRDLLFFPPRIILPRLEYEI